MSILSMLHSRMADLMIISFERDIAGKIKSDRELVRRIWNSGPEGRRQLQLYYIGYVVTNLNYLLSNLIL